MSFTAWNINALALCAVGLIWTLTQNSPTGLVFVVLGLASVRIRR